MRNMRSAILLLLASQSLLVGCSGDPSGNDEPRLSGTYQIAGTQNGDALSGPWTFQVISHDDDRIVLDWTGGTIVGTLPIRDTAQWNVDAYRLDWQAVQGATTYIARISGTSCVGRSFNILGGSGEWSSCTISRP